MDLKYGPVGHISVRAIYELYWARRLVADRFTHGFICFCCFPIIVVSVVVIIKHYFSVDKHFNEHGLGDDDGYVHNYSISDLCDSNT